MDSLLIVSHSLDPSLSRLQITMITMGRGPDYLVNFYWGWGSLVWKWGEGGWFIFEVLEIVPDLSWVCQIFNSVPLVF